MRKLHRDDNVTLAAFELSSAGLPRWVDFADA
jgi:hypothetical protein